MAVEGLREASSKRLEMPLQLHRVCLMMLGIATVFGGDLHALHGRSFSPQFLTVNQIYGVEVRLNPRR